MMLPREAIAGHIKMAKDSVRAADAPLGVITAVDRLVAVIEILIEEIETEEVR